MQNNLDLTFVNMCEMRNRNVKAKAYSISVRNKQKAKNKLKDTASTCLLLSSEIILMVCITFEAFNLWILF